MGKPSKVHDLDDEKGDEVLTCYSICGRHYYSARSYDGSAGLNCGTMESVKLKRGGDAIEEKECTQQLLGGRAISRLLVNEEQTGICHYRNNQIL